MIDAYQFVVNPVVIGKGMKMFAAAVAFETAKDAEFWERKCQLWKVNYIGEVAVTRHNRSVVLSNGCFQLVLLVGIFQQLYQGVEGAIYWRWDPFRVFTDDALCISV